MNLNFNSLKTLKFFDELINKEIKEKQYEIFSKHKSERNITIVISLIVKDINTTRNIANENKMINDRIKIPIYIVIG